MKLDSSYPNAQFHIDGYQFPPFRKDRHKYGGGKMVYTRDGIIAKRLENLEGKHSETICLELTVSKKKWCITFAYRPPSNDNKAIFFNELTTSLSQITNLFDYFVHHATSDLCDTFSFKLSQLLGDDRNLFTAKLKANITNFDCMINSVRQ